MRNLLQIFIAGIFLLGTLLPGANSRAQADGVHLAAHQTAHSMGQMQQVQQPGSLLDKLSDCPAAQAKKDGKSSSETCCPASCFLDLAILQGPGFSGRKLLPPYMPMTASLTGASGFQVERPPKL